MSKKPWESLSVSETKIHSLNTFSFLHVKFLSEKAILQQSFGLRCFGDSLNTSLLLQMPSYSARTSVSGIKLWNIQKRKCCASQDYRHWEGRWYNCTRTCSLKQTWVKVKASAREVRFFFFLMPRHMPVPCVLGCLGKIVVLLPLEEVYIILCSISRGCYYVPGRTRSQ